MNPIMSAELNELFSSWIKKGYVKSIEEAADAAKQIIASEHDNGWIPADEAHMPNDCVNVLVKFEYFRYGEYNRMFTTVGISFAMHGEWSNLVNGTSGWRDLRILAWQPLPED